MPGETEDSKRKGLMDRVLALFFREGVSSLTMEGIALSIGISKRTLYKYFAGKESLIDTVLQNKLESVEAEILSLESSGLPYLERLYGFFSVIEQAVKPMANKLMMDLLKNAPWIWQKIDDFRHTRILNHLEALLVEGRKLGYLRPDVDVRIISPVYIMVIEQIGRPEILVKLSVAPHEIVSTLIKILLGGILSEKGRGLFDGKGKEGF